MSTTPFPAVVVAAPWEVTDQHPDPAATELLLQNRAGATARVRLERCVSGRLEAAYPASVHDVEVQVTALSDPLLLAGLLEVVAGGVRTAEPSCRRVVFGAPLDSPGAVAAAEQAGFRYVVDIDLADAELSLLVSEPEWVAVGDEAADTVPGS